MQKCRIFLGECHTKFMLFCRFFQGWRKTDQHKACEQKLIDALVSLARENEIDVCLTGMTGSKF